MKTTPGFGEIRTQNIKIHAARMNFSWTAQDLNWVSKQ